MNNTAVPKVLFLLSILHDSLNRVLNEFDDLH